MNLAEFYMSRILSVCPESARNSSTEREVSLKMFLGPSLTSHFVASAPFLGNRVESFELSTGVAFADVYA